MEWEFVMDVQLPGCTTDHTFGMSRLKSFLHFWPSGTALQIEFLPDELVSQLVFAGWHEQSHPPFQFQSTHGFISEVWRHIMKTLVE
jgi:hypothetical protein